jgi:hypothetical protein
MRTNIINESLSIENDGCAFNQSFLKKAIVRFNISSGRIVSVNRNKIFTIGKCYYAKSEALEEFISSPENDELYKDVAEYPLLKDIYRERILMSPTLATAIAKIIERKNYETEKFLVGTLSNGWGYSSYTESDGTEYVATYNPAKGEIRASQINPQGEYTTYVTEPFEYKIRTESDELEVAKVNEGKMCVLIASLFPEAIKDPEFEEHFDNIINILSKDSTKLDIDTRQELTNSAVICSKNIYLRLRFPNIKNSIKMTDGKCGSDGNGHITFPSIDVIAMQNKSFTDMITFETLEKIIPDI